MGKFDAYKIDLKGMKENTASYEYVLDNHFFETIDAPEVQKGKLTILVNIKRTVGFYELRFKTEGVVQIPCDRCLDDMDLPISSCDVLKVKLGDEYSEDGDIVIIPEDEGFINVAWFIYEFIVLSIPIKHVHAPGKCNKEMEGKLKKLLRTSAEEEDFEENKWNDSEESLQSSSEIDPRWNELKKIIDNN